MLTTVQGECRLFDLTRGGRFTLPNFGSAPAEIESVPFELRVLRVVKHPTGPHELADPWGHLARAYGAKERSLVLVRPDGYVGLISDAGHTSTVVEYFASIRSGLHLLAC